MQPDHIDALLEQQPGGLAPSDASVLGVVSRVEQLGKRMRQDLQSILKPLGLDPSSFEALAALRQQGPPFAMSPTALRRATAITSGAMTSRIDRLEDLGLVTRAPDPADRRGVRVVMTPAGRELADQAMESRLSAARRFASRLSEPERVTIVSLLDKLMGVAPASASPPDPDAATARITEVSPDA
ncbi:MAG: MarR family transcriptional regulator [Gemmatimonadales bacterium]|jgi:DNA-binding MarR family transcriptional regulator